MTASTLSMAASMMSAFLPRSILEARTRCMRIMIPCCIERVLLPTLAEGERGEFVQRMVNILLVGASEHFSEAEWTQLITRLRHWTGPQEPSTPNATNNTRRRAR